MAHKRRTLTMIGLLLTLLWLAACNPAAPTSEPTPNLDLLRTEVAATVRVQVVQELALTPSATPPANPTATQQPSATPEEPTASPEVTSTRETAEAIGDNQARWVSQSVADDTVFAPGETFTMSWRLRNAGSTTWTADYMLRFYSGNAFGATQELVIGQEVPPGEEIEINVEMKAPANPGNYRSDWVMATESRGNFNEPVFLKIKVALPTPSATPTQ